MAMKKDTALHRNGEIRAQINVYVDGQTVVASIVFSQKMAFSMPCLPCIVMGS